MIDPFAVLALGGPVEASEDPVVSQEFSATGLMILDTTGISFGAFLSGLGCLVGWGGVRKQPKAPKGKKSQILLFNWLYSTEAS